MIEYKVSKFTASDKSVEVTYTNELGHQHKRFVNIPRNSDGSVDQPYFQEILEGQLRGVERKLQVGAISFTESAPAVKPTPEPELETSE